MPKWHFSKPRIPYRAVIITIAALAVPFVDTIFHGTESESNALLWLLALIPAFLLAYYRGWRGVATALAAGMAALSIAACIAIAQGSDLNPAVLLPVLTAYIAIALAVGMLSERLHDNRASAEMLALTDELTGLANRRRARMFLEHHIKEAQRGTPLSVVMFDLDRFKAYNDRNGHPAGDIMLCAFANVLTHCATDQDLVVRYGGEEFLVVLTGSDERQAVAFAENVRTELRQVQKTADAVTVSGGVATYGSTFNTSNDLIIAADRALYFAKQQGRDRVCIATQTQAALV